MDHDGHWGFFAHHHHGPGIVGGIFFLLLVALAIAALVWLVMSITGRGPAPTAVRGDGALETVRMRYARGEIDRDEFSKLNADLGGPA